jgi:hypothetical protein
MTVLSAFILFSGCSSLEVATRSAEIPVNEQYVNGTVVQLSDTLFNQHLKDSIELVPYPSPFSPPTTVSFHVPEKDSVTISIYAMNGTFLNVAFQGELLSGNYLFEPTELHMNSGVYLIRFQVGQKDFVRKTILMR